MTILETQIRLLVAWTDVRARRLREADNDAGELLVWVVMTALLVAAAIAIVAIIVNKATQKANSTNTQ